MDDEFIKYLKKQFEDIHKLKNNEKLEIKLNSSSIKVRKEQKYQGYVFSGYGSKNIAKLFLEHNGEYLNLIQSMKDGYRQFVVIKSLKKLFTTTKNDLMVFRNMYEVVRSDYPCKPYLDIEWNYSDKYFSDIIDYKNNCFDSNFDKFYEKMNSDIINIFKSYDIKLKEKNILWLSSHSEEKISFHVIINKKIRKKTIVYETNRKRCQGSAWHLYLSLVQIDDRYKKILDEAVYSTDREFRMIYSNKNKKKTFVVDDMDFRPMIRLGDTIDRRDKVNGLIKYSEFKKYLITDYNQYEIIDVPKVDKKYMIMNKKKYFSFTEGFMFDDDKISMILKLVKKIHPTAVFTGKSFSSDGYRFTYTDRDEPCYTGNIHKSNGFMVFIEKNGEINMKCLSENCKGKKILRTKFEKKIFNKK